MKARIPCLLVPLLLLPDALVQAAMTAGWQVPVEVFGISPKETEGVRKLDKPPVASPFFRPGDEVWDVSAVIMGSASGYSDAEPIGSEPAEAKKWPGEWVVWNARSGMIVARGEKRDLRVVDMLVDERHLPTLLRTKLELVSGAAGKTASASLVTRSGEKGSLASDYSKMVVETFEGGGYVDERLELKWSTGETDWTLNTALTLRDGERLRIASHADAADSWDLFVTATVEYLHGVPVAALRWQESKGNVIPWPMPVGGDPPEMIEGGLTVGTYRLPGDFVERIGSNSDELPMLEVPASVARWSKEPVVDLRERMRATGLKLSEPGAVVGFHLPSHTLVTVTSLEDRELLEVLLLGGCDHRPASLWIEASASGSCGLVSRSGEKATLIEVRGEEQRVIEIEPILGGNDRLVDLRYRCDIEMSPGKFQRLESSTSLLRDQPQPIASLVLPGREEQKVTMVARYKTQAEEEAGR